MGPGQELPCTEQASPCSVCHSPAKQAALSIFPAGATRRIRQVIYSQFIFIFLLAGMRSYTKIWLLGESVSFPPQEAQQPASALQRRELAAAWGSRPTEGLCCCRSCSSCSSSPVPIAAHTTLQCHPMCHGGTTRVPVAAHCSTAPGEHPARSLRKVLREDLGFLHLLVAGMRPPRLFTEHLWPPLLAKGCCSRQRCLKEKGPDFLLPDRSGGTSVPSAPSTSTSGSTAVTVNLLIECIIYRKYGSNGLLIICNVSMANYVIACNMGEMFFNHFRGLIPVFIPRPI